MRAPRIVVALAVFVLASGATAENVFIHFEDMNTGDNVAGLGTLHPSLDIQPLNAFGPLTVIQTFYEGTDDTLKVYKAPNRNAWDDWHTNNALEDVFGDIVDSTRADWKLECCPVGSTPPPEGQAGCGDSRTPIPSFCIAHGFANTACSWLSWNDFDYGQVCPQEFLITFGSRRVHKFKMLMVDYGDFNPEDLTGTPGPPRVFPTDHGVYLRGYENGLEVAVPYVVEYTTLPEATPRWCSLGFDPKVEADACDSQQSGLGHVHMEVHAPPGSTGLDRIELSMGAGWDPNAAFDSLSIGFVNLFDVHPVSCPNPLNQGGRGMLPAAVLGSGEFDVFDIDPSTCTLEGVPATRWAYDDVSRPYVGELTDKMSCTGDGPDGYTDLTLKFDNQSVSEAVGKMPKDSVVVVRLACTLWSGDPFHSEDIMIVVN